MHEAQQTNGMIMSYMLWLCRMKCFVVDICHLINAIILYIYFSFSFAILSFGVSFSILFIQVNKRACAHWIQENKWEIEKGECNAITKPNRHYVLCVIWSKRMQFERIIMCHHFTSTELKRHLICTTVAMIFDSITLKSKQTFDLFRNYSNKKK